MQEPALYTGALASQDVLVVTAPGSGAEVIPFLKTWVNLPMAIGFTVRYAKETVTAIWYCYKQAAGSVVAWMHHQWHRLKTFLVWRRLKKFLVCSWPTSCQQKPCSTRVYSLSSPSSDPSRSSCTLWEMFYIPQVSLTFLIPILLALACNVTAVMTDNAWRHAPPCRATSCCFCELAEFCENLLTNWGVRFAGPIAILRNWTFCLFYVMAELWGSVVVSLLFWGFANQVTTFHLLCYLLHLMQV